MFAVGARRCKSGVKADGRADDVKWIGAVLPGGEDGWCAGSR